jgi:TatD DNase family protein
MYLDFHTHSSINNVDTTSIYNGMICKEGIGKWQEWNTLQAISLGIHPWYIEEDSLDDQYQFLIENGKSDNVKYIGEVGLDKLKGPNLKLQKEVFLAQIHIAESLNKPLVIHCVRSFNELLEIHKKVKPKVPMIIHGFAKKSDLGRALLANDFFLSFGKEIINKPHVQDTFLMTPLDRIFLETDTSEDITIQQIYQKAAELKEISLGSLKDRVLKNYIGITQNH